MKPSHETLMRILKYAALSSAIIAAIAVTLLVGFVYNLQRNDENKRSRSLIEFTMDRNPKVATYSNAKIYVNGVDKYERLRSDSTGKLSVSVRAEEGFRPVGEIHAVMHSVDNNAVSLMLQYKEGANHRTKFTISPTLTECDSACLSKINIRSELDSLRSKIQILERKIDKDEF